MLLIATCRWVRWAKTARLQISPSLRKSHGNASKADSDAAPYPESQYFPQEPFMRKIPFVRREEATVIQVNWKATTNGCIVLQLLECSRPQPDTHHYRQKLDKNCKKMVHFMQLDDRWLAHLLTTLRALLGAAASFSFGHAERSSTLGNISFCVCVRSDWLKEQQANRQSQLTGSIADW